MTGNIPIAHQIIKLRLADPSVTLTEIARTLDIKIAYVTNVIAKKRKRGGYVPVGTSTSKGKSWRYTPERKRRIRPEIDEDGDQT